MHLSVFPLILLGLLQLLQAVGNLDLGVLHIVVNSVDDASLEKFVQRKIDGKLILKAFLFERN